MSAEVVALKNEIQELIARMADVAREAYGALGEASGEQRSKALLEAAAAIRASSADIQIANEKDVVSAQMAGMDEAMLDRLTLTPSRIEAMAKGLEDIAALPDPLGKVIAQWTRPNGLNITRVSVPLGVIGIIYESRPNVTADAAALCIKSGNAAILRGGSDSLNSAQAIARCLHAGLKAAGLHEGAVQLVPTRDRAAVGEMLGAVGLIDIIVPRGGKSLTERVQRESRVPTILHLDGNCHTYVHAAADAAMARDVVVNAKMRRTGVCGATESLLIDESVAAKLLPELTSALVGAGCALRGDDAARKIDSRITAASDEDWATEYLAPIISVKIVSGAKEAIAHINHYGSHHTDAIITADADAAEMFLRKVDSAIVLHNASTQFADGGEFGMGAEIGISTGRLHARGPVGAEQLTTYKYVVHGSGQIRPA